MPDLFRIFVTVSLVNLASRGLSTLAADLLKVDMRTKSAQAAMSRLRSSLLVGGGMIMAGSAMVKFLGKAVDLAADVELSVTRLQSLTQGSAEQMGEFTRRTQEAAHATAIFSQKEAAELGVTIEQSTKMSIGAISKTLPMFAMFAEAQQKLHGTSATAAVTAAGQISRVMGITPEEMPAFLERLHRMSAALPKTMQLPQVQNDITRSVGLVAGLGADKRQMMEVMELAAFARSLGGGRAFGGQNLSTAITRSITPTKPGAEAEKALGIQPVDPRTGKFDIFRLEEQLRTVRAKHPGMADPEFLKMMKAIFGQQALPLMSTLAAPGTQKKRADFTAAEARVDPINLFVQKFLNTFSGAKTQAITDFASAMAEFGKHLLPVLVPLIHFFDNIIVSATKFMQAHPALTKLVAILAALGSAGLVVGGVVTILAGVGSFLVTITGLSLGTLGAVLAGVAAGLAAVAASAMVLYKFFKAHPKEWEKLKNEMAVIMGELKKIFIELKPVLSEAARVLKPLVEVWLEMFVQKLYMVLKAVEFVAKGLKFELGGGISGLIGNAISNKLKGFGIGGKEQAGPPKPSGYNAPGKKGGMMDTPGIYQNQVAGIGLVKIIVNGSGNPKEVADEVVKKLAAVTRQSAKGSGNVEELAYATPFMYT